MKKTRKKYTLGFKILAASISIHCGRVIEVARELNISAGTLQHRKKLYKDGKFGAKKQHSPMILIKKAHENEETD